MLGDLRGAGRGGSHVRYGYAPLLFFFVVYLYRAAVLLMIIIFVTLGLFR